MNAGYTLLTGIWPLTETLISRTGSSMQDKEIRNMKRGAVQFLSVEYLILYNKHKANNNNNKGET